MRNVLVVKIAYPAKLRSKERQLMYEQNKEVKFKQKKYHELNKEAINRKRTEEKGIKSKQKKHCELNKEALNRKRREIMLPKNMIGKITF